MKKHAKKELLHNVPMGLRKSKVLTPKQQLVLGQLMMLSGLDQYKDKGYCYRSNKDFCNDVGISEPSLISAVNKLERLGFIKRRRGKRGEGASEYVLFMDVIESYNTKKENFSNQNSKELLEFAERVDVLQSLVIQLLAKISRLEAKFFSTDTESETELDTDLEYKNLYNKELIDKEYNKILYYKNNNILEYNKNKLEKEKTNKLGKKKEDKDFYRKNLEEESTDGDSTDSKENNTSNCLDSLFINPTDYEEDTDFIMDLDKRVAYNRWDSEDEETAVTESRF